MQMDKLTDAERSLPRRTRRALQAQRSIITQKHTPFGRVKVLDIIDDIDDPEKAYVSYKHSTKGILQRRMTWPLMDNLISVG